MLESFVNEQIKKLISEISNSNTALSTTWFFAELFLWKKNGQQSQWIFG